MIFCGERKFYHTWSYDTCQKPQLKIGNLWYSSKRKCSTKTMLVILAQNSSHCPSYICINITLKQPVIFTWSYVTLILLSHKSSSYFCAELHRSRDQMGEVSPLEEQSPQLVWVLHVSAYSLESLSTWVCLVIDSVWQCLGWFHRDIWFSLIMWGRSLCCIQVVGILLL